MSVSECVLCCVFAVCCLFVHYYELGALIDFLVCARIALRNGYKTSTIATGKINKQILCDRNYTGFLMLNISLSLFWVLFVNFSGLLHKNACACFDHEQQIQTKKKQQNHRKKVGDKSTTTIKATERYPTHNTTNIYRPRPIAFNHHTSYIESLCVRLSVVCVIPVCSQSCMFAVCCRCYSIYIDLIKWFAYKYSVAASFGFELCFFLCFLVLG